MADPMQQARELLAETLDAIADDTRYHALNGEQHDHLREAAAALRAAPEGYFLVPVYPSGDWVRSVMHPWEPALNEGGKSWRKLEDELLHWHAAMLAARPQGVNP